MSATSKTRAVIVGGIRTPFVRAFGSFLKMDTIALGGAAVRGLIEEFGLNPKEIGSIIWGGVILPSTAPNVGREIALDLGLPAGVEAKTVTRACASGLQAITDAAALIERGEADVVIAGGSESTSNVGIELPNEVVHAMAPLVMGKGAGPKEVFQVVKDLWPFNRVLPGRPRIAERTTGELMGESAEKMAGIWGISRASQDELSFRSHQRAAAAVKAGYFASEITPVVTPQGQTVQKDGLLRDDTTVEKLARLRPVFKEDGTLTAGNSSALTDGAGCVLLMSEEKAKKLGYKPLATLASWAYVGVDPADQLLIGPALAMPLAAQRAGVAFKDIDIFDLHEAFAAQVLCNLRAMASADFFKDRTGVHKAFGTIPEDRLNVHGGSLALGHPFAATGPRIVTTMINELQRSGANHALIGICAAGGLAGAALLRRYE